MPRPTVLLFLRILVVSSLAHPQSTAAPERFPYTFSNFIWWSDADLRVELKHRIPSLSDDLARNSPLEDRIRTSLITLLKTKGIQADIQIQEPDADVATHHFVEGAPSPSIVFSIALPQILIDKLIFDGAPPATLATL